MDKVDVLKGIPKNFLCYMVMGQAFSYEYIRDLNSYFDHDISKEDLYSFLEMTIAKKEGLISLRDANEKEHKGKMSALNQIQEKVRKKLIKYINENKGGKNGS